MTILHLGVIDQNYRTSGPGYRGKTGKPGRRKRAQITSRTTYEVAQFLEAKYHVMEVFYEAHAQEIADMMANAYAGAVETALMTGRPPAPLDQTGIGKIAKAFNDYIDMEEMARLGVPGVPTQAALDGVSHRFAHPYAKHARRPSFYDTGLYEASFIAWVD
jgi:hypothetical protein